MSASLCVCVYCGSRSGSQPAYEEASRGLGRRIGQLGWTMVYGGGRVGLMGSCADAALAASADVHGVIPKALMNREVGHTGLTRLDVVDTMHQRKQLMADRADVFVVLPGGVGTLEELFEVWSWRQLGYHDKPIGLLNIAGYFDELLRFMAHAAGQGFVTAAQQQQVIVDINPDRLLSRLAEQAGSADAPDDYSQV